MKKKATHLFELIQSMTMSEKRYFKIYCSRHVIGKRNKYLELFDAIDRHGDSGTKKFKEKHGDLVKDRYSQKAYLYQLILKSMDFYNAEDSIERKTGTRIGEAEYLFNKGLYEQCSILLVKAKDMGIKYQLYSKLKDILTIEINIMVATGTGDKGKISEELIKLDTITTTIETLRNYHERIHDFFTKWGDDVIRNKTLVKELKHLVPHKLLAEDHKTLPFFRGQIRLLSLQSAYFRMMRDWEHYYKISRLSVELLESQSAVFKTQNLAVYASGLLSMLLGALILRKDTAFILTLKKLKSLPDQAGSRHRNFIDNVVFIGGGTAEIQFHNAHGTFEESAAICKHTEKHLNTMNKMADENLTDLYYNMAVAWFGYGDHKKALFWLRRIEERRGELRGDIGNLSRLLFIIIHYELGNRESLEYYIRSIIRYLIKKERLFAFEKLLLQFFRSEAPKAKNNKEMIVLMRNVKTRIEKIFKDPAEQIFPNDLDIISWLESKIEDRPFAEVVRNKKNQLLNFPST